MDSINQGFGLDVSSVRTRAGSGSTAVLGGFDNAKAVIYDGDALGLLPVFADHAAEPSEKRLALAFAE